jgi:hypothetical protein
MPAIPATNFSGKTPFHVMLKCPYMLEYRGTSPEEILSISANSNNAAVLF